MQFIVVNTPMAQRATETYGMHYKSTHACSPIMCVGWELEMLPTLLYMYNTSFVPRRSPTRIDFSIHVRDTECAPH